MFTIISALKAELQPVLQAVNPSSEKLLQTGKLYLAGRLHLLRLQVGGQNAAGILRAYLRDFRPEFVLNIGFAGLLSEQKPEPCSVFTIRRISEADTGDLMELDVLAPTAHLPSAALLTVSHPVLEREDKKRLHARFGADLVDMEAFALAQVCHSFNTPFFALKSVTDGADENTVHDFKKHYRQCARALFSAIRELVQ